jgi:hypothetical protein
MAYLPFVHLARPNDPGAWRRALLALGAVVGIQILGRFSRSVVFTAVDARSPAFHLHQKDLLCDNRHPLVVLLGTAYLFGCVAFYYSIVVRSVPPPRRSLLRFGLILSLIAAIPLSGLLFIWK